MPRVSINRGGGGGHEPIGDTTGAGNLGGPENNNKF